jgi:murein DD-endopeptidase MepM/ murein hydrolase activator NlpD
VPHYGIDIVVGENTPVRSAAEGVVFLVRDGGDTGYTYVLIGHRGGMATLYGHLRLVNVATGQDVSAGQVIGLSGGKPGTPGAGPLTTAPHLHFEVIQNGSNVDPRTVLP